jgi:hypothetical protein
MYHYDFLYRWFPVWLATALYLVFFVGLGWGTSKLVELIMGKKLTAIIPPVSGIVDKNKKVLYNN